MNHLQIAVSNLTRSRDWYTQTLGLKVEFEIPDRNAVALQETAGFTIFLQAGLGTVPTRQNALWFQVEDVDATVASWAARGIYLAEPARKHFWGYGAELADPDGHLVRLWDEKSMRER